MKRHARELVLAIDEALARVDALQVALSSWEARTEDLASRAAEESERSRIMFELVPEAVFVTDTRGVIRDFNVGATTLLDVPAAALIGKPVYVYVAMRDRYRLRRAMASLRPGSRFSGVAELVPRHTAPIEKAVTIHAVSGAKPHEVILSWVFAKPGNDTARRGSAYA